MNKNVGDFMKGMGMGMALGCTAGIVGFNYLKKNVNKKGIKHNAGRAMHTIGDLLDNVTDMF